MADDSLDDELLEAVGRNRGSDQKRSSGTSKRRRRESSSDEDDEDDERGYKRDTDDDEDEYDDEKGGGRRRDSGSKMPLKKRFDDADKDEDEAGYDSDLSFGSDLYKNEEDRARLADMTELEREMILHDRAELRDNFMMRKRAGARQKKDNSKQRDRDTAPPSSRVRSSARDSSKSVKQNALHALVAKRQKAHDSDQRRRRVVKEPSPSRRKSRDSSSFSSSDSSDDDRSSKDEAASEGGHSDDEQDQQKKELMFDDVSSVTIRRSKLAKWFLEPFFEEIIVGCFVRVGIGIKDNHNIYRLCQVKNVDARNPNKQYKFENRMTHKYLNLLWGDSEARWQMARISDQPPAKEEFEQWKKEVEKSGGRSPSLAEILDKREAIAKLSSFVYSAALVKQMLQEKKLSSSRPSNVAAEKDRVLKELALAESKEDQDEVERLQGKLKDLEVYSAQNQSKDAKALALAQMNRRNRFENFKNASDLKPVNAKAGEAGYDPFSRRWTRSQNYYDRSLKVDNVDSSKASEAAAAAAQEAAADAGKLVDTLAPVADDTKLFSLHDFHLPISLVGIQKFGGAQGAHLAFIARKQRLEATCGVPRQNNDGRRHMLALTVNDYKRRRGLL